MLHKAAVEQESSFHPRLANETRAGTAGARICNDAVPAIRFAVGVGSGAGPASATEKAATAAAGVVPKEMLFSDGKAAGNVTAAGEFRRGRFVHFSQLQHGEQCRPAGARLPFLDTDKTSGGGAK